MPSATVAWERCAPCSVDPIQPLSPSCFHEDTGSIPGSVDWIQTSLPGGTEGAHLWEKFSLPCTVSVSQGFDVWDLGCGAMACSPCYKLRKNTMVTFGIFHSPATACPSSGVVTFDDLMAWPVQSKPALHPEGHSRTFFGHRWPCLLCHNLFSLALFSSLSVNARFSSQAGELHFLSDAWLLLESLHSPDTLAWVLTSHRLCVTGSLTKAASRLKIYPSLPFTMLLSWLIVFFSSILSQIIWLSSFEVFSWLALSRFWSHFQNISIHTVDVFVQILSKMWISFGFLVFICGLRYTVAEMDRNHCR